MSIRIGTRGSKSALAQTSTVSKKLSAHGIETEQVIITTQGDTTTGIPLHEIGGQGVFVRALDDAILAGTIDCAVHSMKDIPAYRPSGIVTAAVLKRDSPADYIAYNGSLHTVKVIGTSRTRRSAQLLRHDPDITTKDLRGNVDTRIRRCPKGNMMPLSWQKPVSPGWIYVSPVNGYHRKNLSLPPNQGTIAVVSRADPSLMEVLSALDHPDPH